MLFRYTLKNLLARPASTFSTVIAIAVTAASITAMLGISQSLFATLTRSSDPLNVVVLSKEVRLEQNSRIPNPTLNMLQAAPGVKKDGDTALVSAERLVVWQFPREGASLETIPIRGVDPVAFSVHPGITVEGRFPNPGEAGLVVGAKVVGRVEGLQLGGKARMLRTEWPVVGILRAPGTRYETEIWSDRRALGTELREEVFNSAYARLENAGALEQFQRVVGRDENLRLEAVWEPDYFVRVFNGVNVFAKLVAMLAFALALGATLASINTIYAAFLSRIHEVATLAAMGFGRGRITAIVLQECLLLALVGGLAGVGAAWALDGREFSFEAARLYCVIHLSPQVLLAGAASAAAIGVAGSIGTIIQVLRFDILDALRSA